MCYCFTSEKTFVLFQLAMIICIYIIDSKGIILNNHSRRILIEIVIVLSIISHCSIYIDLIRRFEEFNR